MAKLILIDANAIIHKAYYAIKTLTNRDGQEVNAIYGFSSILLKIIREMEPDYMCGAYDLPKPTFRHIEYELYKSTRIAKPDALLDQIPKTKEILKGFNIPICEKEGFEADDVIGTLAEKYQKNAEVWILTGDLDTLQLVNDRIKVYALRKGITDIVIYDEKQVFERFGLKPEQMIDYKGLRGDPSDNIPGVKGVGEKTACVLLKEFGTIENLYEKIEKMPLSEIKKYKFLTEKNIEKLKNGKEMAFFSEKLATICREVMVDTSLDDLNWKDGYNIKNAEMALDKFHFKSLINRLYGRTETRKTPPPQQKLI